MCIVSQGCCQRGQLREPRLTKCCGCAAQIEAIEQTAQQAVTVVLRNMAPLRKLARGAGAPVRRDAYGLNIRLGIRQAATAELMEASSCLLDDLAHLFRLLAGQPSAAGQHGRTSGRHIATIATVPHCSIVCACASTHANKQSITVCFACSTPDLATAPGNCMTAIPDEFSVGLQDLKGAEHQFSEISKELKLAGRFLLVRDPGTGKNPTLDERTVEEGAQQMCCWKPIRCPASHQHAPPASGSAGRRQVKRCCAASLQGGRTSGSWSRCCAV